MSKVLVITTSLRAKSNSDILAERLIAGANDAGHEVEHIKALAEKYQKSSAQIILRWQLQAGFIAIPGSSNPDHIAENYDIFDFALTEAELAQIAQLNRGARYESW